MSSVPPSTTQYRSLRRSLHRRTTCRSVIGMNNAKNALSNPGSLSPIIRVLAIGSAPCANRSPPHTLLLPLLISTQDPLHTHTHTHTPLAPTQGRPNTRPSREDRPSRIRELSKVSKRREKSQGMWAREQCKYMCACTALKCFFVA
jgi:hypothetical protein